MKTVTLVKAICGLMSLPFPPKQSDIDDMRKCIDRLVMLGYDPNENAKAAEPALEALQEWLNEPGSVEESIEES